MLPTTISHTDYSHKWWVMLAVAMGTFLCTIDGSIVNVALPTLVSELDTTFAAVQWVVLSYLLVVTSLMLGIARLGDIIGKRRIYLTGMGLFTSVSALCGLAPSIGFLIAFRALQGVGAAMLMALGMAIVTEAFPPTERGRALGINGTIVSLGISLGPTLGGLLIGSVSWRAIFLVNLPVGIAGLALGQRFLPDRRPAGGQRFDPFGAIIMLLALVLLALGLTFGPNSGWGSPVIVGLLGGAFAGLAIFLIVESHLHQPMIDLNLFRNPVFGINLLTGSMVFIVIAGLFVIPFYLEQVKGYDPQLTGLFLVVVPSALGFTAPVAGALSDRYGSRGISLLGLIVVVGACLSIAALKETTSVTGYILHLLPLGFGAGLFQSPNNSAVIGAAPREQIGVASGLLALSRTMAQVAGISLSGAVFASRVIGVSQRRVEEAPPWAIVRGIEHTFTLAAGLIAVGVVLATLGWTLERRQVRQAKLSSPAG